VIAKYGKPDIIWTEFVSADGLVKGNREVLLRDLVFTESERPIIAQFFSATPQYMEAAARLALELGFDGIDINMGCPDKSIEKQKAGAMLMKNPKLAQELIAAAKRGATTPEKSIPVSVKTRIGYNKVEIEEWIPALLEAQPVAITVHGRTRKEMSKVDAHWDIIKRAVEIRNEKGSRTLILGNGDVKTLDDANVRVRETGVDGVMIGRGIFGNPWLFNKERKIEDITIEEKLSVMIEHTKLFLELLGDLKSFALMKKHYKAYVHGFDGAKELRVELMEAETIEQIEAIVAVFLKKLEG
jgi:nifR3 family TIM-barrel protein